MMTICNPNPYARRIFSYTIVGLRRHKQAVWTYAVTETEINVSYAVSLTELPLQPEVAGSRLCQLDMSNGVSMLVPFAPDAIGQEDLLGEDGEIANRRVHRDAMHETIEKLKQGWEHRL